MACSEDLDAEQAALRVEVEDELASILDFDHLLAHRFAGGDVGSDLEVSGVCRSVVRCVEFLGHAGRL